MVPENQASLVPFITFFPLYIPVSVFTLWYRETSPVVLSTNKVDGTALSCVLRLSLRDFEIFRFGCGMAYLWLNQLSSGEKPFNLSQIPGASPGFSFFSSFKLSSFNLFNISLSQTLSSSMISQGTTTRGNSRQMVS